jgi:hypothetical protein
MAFQALSEADYESHSILRFSVEREGLTRSQMLRGNLPAHRPIRAVRQHGSKPVDYTDMSICVVSASFRKVVVQRQLTGIEFGSLLVDHTAGEWFLVSITGRCTTFDFSRSERFEKVIRKIGGGESRIAYLRGFEIPPSGLPSNDFFLSPESDQIVVTQRARDSLASHPLTNVAFTPIDRYEISERNLRKAAGLD